MTRNEVNLTDKRFHGKYLEDVVGRSRAAGVKSMIITGVGLSQSRKALDLARRWSMDYLSL